MNQLKLALNAFGQVVWSVLPKALMVLGTLTLMLGLCALISLSPLAMKISNGIFLVVMAGLVTSWVLHVGYAAYQSVSAAVREKMAEIEKQP